MAEKTSKADQLRALREDRLKQLTLSPAERLARARALADARLRETASNTPPLPTEEGSQDMAAKRKTRAGTKKAAKPAKRAVKAKKRKAAAKAPRKTNGAATKRGDKATKVAIVANLLTRSGGCTRVDVLKATGWPSVSMQQQANAAGLKLAITKNKGEPKRYAGTPL